MDTLDISTSSLIPSEHQAAGHDGCMTLNSLFFKPTNQQELDFYTKCYEVDHQRLNKLENKEKEAEEEGEEEEGVDLGALITHWMPAWLGILNEGDIRVNHRSSVSNSPSSQLHNQQDLVKPNTEKTQYIVLQNLYHKYLHPSILDIKLGSKLTDDSKTTKEKIARLQKVSETTTSGSLGFRICGMKQYIGKETLKPQSELFHGMNENTIVLQKNKECITINGETIVEHHNYLEYNKHFGRSLNKHNVEDALQLFFSKIPPTQAAWLIQRFHQRLQLLYNCLLSYEVRIFSGSLLFIIEGDKRVWKKMVDEEKYANSDPLICEFDPTSDDEKEEEEEEFEKKEPAKEKQANLVNTIFIPVNESPEKLSGLHIIDFAHAKFVEGAGHDDNILDGIENLIDIFAKLAENNV